MAWIHLLIAGIFEVGFTTALRFADGFTRPMPSLIFLVCAVASLLFLQWASASIPLGTAYAIWVGIGAAGTVLVGALWFGEPTGSLRLLFLAILIASVIGLKLVS